MSVTAALVFLSTTYFFVLLLFVAAVIWDISPEGIRRFLCLSKKEELFTLAQVEEMILKAVQEAKSPLVEAIKAIYTAPVYQEQKRENGVSLEFITALYAAAETAGLKPLNGPLAPVYEELADLLEVLEKRHIYPKLLGNDICEWLIQIRALIMATNPKIEPSK